MESSFSENLLIAALVVVVLRIAWILVGILREK